MFYLDELNDSNYEELSKLKITKEQEKFVKNFDKCVEYQKQNPFLKIFGIRKDNIYIGLTAIARWDSDLSIPVEKRSTWFDEFFIDVKYQHHHYGDHVIPLIMDKIKELYHPKAVVLTVRNDNPSAIALYLKHGFNKTNLIYLEKEDTLIKKDHIDKTDEFLMYKYL